MVASEYIDWNCTAIFYQRHSYLHFPKNLMVQQPTANEIIDAIEQQSKADTLTALMGPLITQCFTLCVLTPGASLTGKERDCLERCKIHYKESATIAMNVFAKRLQESQFDD